ncbi:hypothetical protein [Kitasatospora sp. CB02891]|uniref:hypothetical protein n=1 Tax=Kitasatospora sp. CB02891 TaxID=2020329 RepID=UPI0018E1FF2D|nr:hypothetical protein [Kitasatospora sp. CB02891]
MQHLAGVDGLQPHAPVLLDQERTGGRVVQVEALAGPAVLCTMPGIARVVGDESAETL